MKGINHERLNFLLLLPATYYLGYNHLDKILSSIFILLWIIGTLYITCDLDTNSRSRRRLWFLGWIIDMLFSHRGMLHSVWLWAVVGAVGYYCFGFGFIGLVIPQFLHILADKVI